MKCTLCPNDADPRLFIGVHDGYYALCDGCAPNDNKADIARVSDRCRAAAAPDATIWPKFGFNDTREP